MKILDENSMKEKHILKIFIVAGEASGDNLGANLIKSIQKQSAYLAHNFSIEFCGIGGDNMLKAGIKNIMHSNKLSIMGFVEIIPAIPRMLLYLQKVTNYILKYKPDIIITIDSPGFNFLLIRKLRNKLHNKLDIKLHNKNLYLPYIVHYVAPTVWAYNPERAEIIKDLYDHILLILPFESQYFKHTPHTYIGHPILDNYISNNKLNEKSNDKQNKEKYKKSIIVTIMPGSRISEVKRHAKVIKEVINDLYVHYTKTYINKIENTKNIKNIKKIIFFIPTTKDMEKYVKKIFEINDSVLVSADIDAKIQYMNNSTLGIIKSGTSTLEAAVIYKIPMICFYKISPITACIIKKKMKIRYFSLPNIILNKEIIPELLQENFNFNNLKIHVYNLLNDKKLRKDQINAFSKIFNILKYKKNNKTPSELAASVILKRFEQLL